jgi:hypothetical protein
LRPCPCKHGRVDKGLHAFRHLLASLGRDSNLPSSGGHNF